MEFGRRAAYCVVRNSLFDILELPIWVAKIVHFRQPNDIIDCAKFMISLVPVTGILKTPILALKMATLRSGWRSLGPGWRCLGLKMFILPPILVPKMAISTSCCVVLLVVGAGVVLE